MGIYLNPGCRQFEKSIKSKIYIDKTEMIAYTNEMINTKNSFICVSRRNLWQITMENFF